MQISVPEADLTGFNEKAKEKLNEATQQFVHDLIEESNRIESARNSSGYEPEITSSMVNDAKVLVRRGLSQSKKSTQIKLLRIAAAIFPLFVGILYDKQSLQSTGYMLLFIFVITVSILAVTFSIIKE